jgi:hypothetical protein
MSLTKFEFTNEKGNRILVTADTRKVDDVPGVRLTMTGPTSTLESDMTLREADAVRTVLSNLED